MPFYLNFFLRVFFRIYWNIVKLLIGCIHCGYMFVQSPRSHVHHWVVFLCNHGRFLIFYLDHLCIKCWVPLNQLSLLQCTPIVEDITTHLHLHLRNSCNDTVEPEADKIPLSVQSNKGCKWYLITSSCLKKPPRASMSWGAPWNLPASYNWVTTFR